MYWHQRNHRSWLAIDAIPDGSREFSGDVMSGVSPSCPYCCASAISIKLIPDRLRSLAVT